jgi:hypothetical protein
MRIDGLAIESEVFRRITVYKPHFEYIVEITLDLAPAQLGLCPVNRSSRSSLPARLS